LNLPFYIARRYLFARKSHNAINIISIISVCGVAVATIAMVCILSVFNGFTSLVSSMFSYFDPELKITPVMGKVFDPHTEPMERMRQLAEIEVCTETLEDNVLVRYGDRQEVAIAKGVEDSFRRLVEIDSLLIDGQFELEAGETSYAIPGIGLAYTLGVRAGFANPLEILAPERDSEVNLANPASSFNAEYAFTGAVFCLNQPSYDENYVILPIRMVRDLLKYDTEVSALELRLSAGADVNAVRKQIRSLLGDGFKVQDRYEQQAASYRMMQVEKWMSFLILAFVLAIALFNVVSSLYMLMIEKKDDVRMLRSMGADSSLIRRIFMTEGVMIPAAGALAGIVVGIALCLIQQYFGIVKLGNTLGAFVSDNYPVRVEAFDIALVFATIFLLGTVAAWYPVRRLGLQWQSTARLAIWFVPLALCCCNGVQQDMGVAVTIEPQHYFAEKIAGDHLAIHTVVPSGQSPETYDPSPHEMMRIARSKAYLQIGCIGFEQVWMDAIRANNPQLPVFDLSDGVKWIENNDADEHEAGHGHHHGRYDPHIWTSTVNARIIARNVMQAFIQLDPAHEADYLSNYRQMEGEIDATEQTLHRMLDTLTCRTFVIYHPALTYFADEFHLTQMAIEAEGKEPSASSMKALVDKARAAQVKVVFVQQEFDRKHAEQLAAETGAQVAVINPLDRQWSEQLIAIAQALCNP